MVSALLRLLTLHASTCLSPLLLYQCAPIPRSPTAAHTHKHTQWAYDMTLGTWSQMPSTGFNPAPERGGAVGGVVGLIGRFLYMFGA